MSRLHAEKHRIALDKTIVFL